MVDNQLRPSPSPLPTWEILKDSHDTPETSTQDELEQESVLQDLLPTSVLKKRKEVVANQDISTKRPRIGFGRGRDIPSSIQITPRQHPSPGILRNSRDPPGLRLSDGPKRDGDSATVNGSSSKLSAPRRAPTFASAVSSGKSISAPHVARKKTGRKRASSPPRHTQSLSIRSAFTRTVKRTREEKRRQDSDDESFLPFSPTLMPPSGSNKGSRNPAIIISTSRMDSSSRSLLASKQSQTEIIDISSDDEMEPVGKEKQVKDKENASKTVLEISSDDNDEKIHRSQPKESASPSFIEILDSDDEPRPAPAAFNTMHGDELMVEMLARRTTDQINRLSLCGNPSPRDEMTLLPPESASEGSEDLRFGNATPYSSSDSDIREPIQGLAKVDDPNRDSQMDVDETLPLKGNCFSPKIGSRSSSPPAPSGFSDKRSPFVHKNLPGRHSILSVSPSPLSLAQRDFAKAAEGDGSNIETRADPSLSNFPTPYRRSDGTCSISNSGSAENSQKETLSHDDKDTTINCGSPLDASSHKPRCSDTLVSGSLANSAKPTPSPSRTRWSSGMNLADAITQASQDNNRKLPTRAYSETDAEAKGHTENTQVSQNANLKSQFPLEFVQADNFHGRPIRRASSGSARNEVQTTGEIFRSSSDDDASQRQRSVPDTSAMSGSELMMMDKQLVPESVGKPTSTLGNKDRTISPHLPKPQTNAISHDRASVGPDTSKGNESDDGLEYIDGPENCIMIQGIAGINIADGNLEETIDEAIPTDHRRELESGNQFQNQEDSTMLSPKTMQLHASRIASTSNHTLTPSWRNWIMRSEGRRIVEMDGLTIISWREFRQDIKNFTPKLHLCRDLPHALQDYINHMSDWTRSLPDMRTVFIAAIQENTAMDEPDAPPIRVENLVDDEPSPPWEFHYSNHVWHGEGVPPPDIVNLVSCDCVGRCDPRSKSCACMRRQQQALEGQNADFSYDSKGKLKEPGYPIFECNDFCGCDDDCRNRVVQHGRTAAIAIKKTKHKGWGVFADQKKIYNGTFIGVYAGEMITDEEGEERGFYYDKLGRTYLFDIDFHHLRKDHDDWQSKYTVDAYHAGNFTRFLNHSCDPNCILNPCYINEGNVEKPLLAVFARRDIELGEELCFSYSGDIDDEVDNPDGDAANDGTDEKNDAVYARCYCGAKNCKGRLFG